MHGIHLVVGVADVETVVAVRSREVIALPPSLDEAVVRSRRSGRDAEIVRHRAKAEIVLEVDPVFVADLFVENVSDNARADVVRQRDVGRRV